MSSDVPRPRLAVLETDPIGHRLEYVRHLVAGREGSVPLVTGTVARSAEREVHLAGCGITPTVLASDERDAPAVLDEALTVAAARADRLVIPEGDPFVLSLLARFLRRGGLPVPVRLLLLRTASWRGPEPRPLDKLVKALAVGVLRRLPGVEVVFLTDAFGVVRRRRGYRALTAVPDPVARDRPEDPRAPCWLPARPAGGSVVGVFGVISARKNVPLLLEAAHHAPGLAVVVGGVVDPDVRAALHGPRARALCAAGRLVVHDEALSDGEFSAALRAVDVVAVLHDNDAPSGILAEACLRGTPVVVPAGYWPASVVESTGIGRAVPLVPAERAPAAVAEAVCRVARSPRYRAACSRAAARLGTTAFTTTMAAP